MQNGDAQKQIENYAKAQDGKTTSGVSLKVNPSATDSSQKPKKIFWKRILKIAVICFGSLIAFLLVLFLLAILLPGKTVVLPISIGDTTITEEKVNAIRDTMQKTADQFDDEVSFSDDPSDTRTIDEIALDSAIMNAALKDRAKMCNIKLIEDVQGERSQNEVWQGLLEDCVIAKKELLLVGVVFDAPYFANMSDEEANTAYASAKEWLGNVIMPLIDSNEDKVTIANSSGLGGFKALKEPDAGIEKPETFAWDTFCTDKCFNNSFSSIDAEEFPGDLGDIVDQNQLIQELHNVGDHTDIFVASSGIFGIMRLEGNTGGEFNSWNDFLTYYKDAYVDITSVSSITSSIKEWSMNILQSLLPFIDVNAAMGACSLQHHNAVEIFLGVKYVTPDGNGWAWVGGQAANRVSMTVSSQCAGAKPVDVSSVANDGVTYTGQYADCNNYGPYVSNISYLSDTHGVDHINFYCGESRRTCNIGTANDSGIQIPTSVTVLGPEREYATYRCDRDEQYRTCNSVNGANSVASYEEVNSVMVPFRWSGGANAGRDQLRVAVYITDKPSVEQPGLMCYDASGVIRPLNELDIANEVEGWPEAEIRGSDNPADGYSCYIPPPPLDNFCYDPWTNTSVLLPSVQFPDAQAGDLCRPRPPVPDKSSDAPADSYVCRVSTVSPHDCEGWEDPGRQDVKARFPIEFPPSFNAEPFSRSMATDKIRFKHNLNSFSSTYSLRETHSFTYTYPYTYTESYTCYKYGYRRTCRRTKTVNRSASASTTHALNFYFGQNSPSGATTTGPSVNSISNKPNSSLAGVSKNMEITKVVSNGVRSTMVADDNLLKVAGEQIEVTQNHVGTAKHCQLLNIDWRQTFNPSNTTVYANHSGASPSSKVFTHSSVDLKGNINSISACFSVPFLWAVYPKIDSVEGISGGLSLEVDEEITVPWSIQAASNKGSSGTCAPGVAIDVYTEINGTRTVIKRGEGVSCGGISGEFNLKGANVGDKICLYAKVGSITNDPYQMRIYDSNQLGTYVGPPGEANPPCYEVIKRANIQIHGADSWSGTDSSNGGFLAKNSSNTDNKDTQSGSWSQYGLFTTGKIDDVFGSAGWLKTSDDKPSNESTNNFHTRLKFANNNNPNGKFSTNHQTTDMRTYYGSMLTNTNTVSGIDNITTLPDNTSREITNYTSPSNIKLSLGTMAPLNFNGRQILIFNDNVTIAEDIIYGSNFNSIYSIPMLTIIAKNIFINSNVRQIDAILVADESLSTCANGNDATASYKHNGLCADIDTNNIGLTINGAIIAKQTKFQRTNGTEYIGDRTPAELIRYNPAVYLSNYAYQRTQQKNLKTILRREVAPRW